MHNPYIMNPYGTSSLQATFSVSAVSGLTSHGINSYRTCSLDSCTIHRGRQQGLGQSRP